MGMYEIYMLIIEIIIFSRRRRWFGFDIAEKRWQTLNSLIGQNRPINDGQVRPTKTCRMIFDHYLRLIRRSLQ